MTDSPEGFFKYCRKNDVVEHPNVITNVWVLFPFDRIHVFCSFEHLSIEKHGDGYQAVGNHAVGTTMKQVAETRLKQIFSGNGPYFYVGTASNARQANISYSNSKREYFSRL
jgi:hypothetical protein